MEKLKTPVYIIDEDKIQQNLETLKGVKDRTGCKILLAQKAFSCYALYPLISSYLDGTTASGMYEAGLSHEYFHGENHVFSPAFTDEEFEEIKKICTHVVFNSFAQKDKYISKCFGMSAGLRVNPEHSTQGGGIYDPCAPYSRLGVAKENFKGDDMYGIEGLHMHTLCEQGAEDLAATICAFEKKFGRYFPGLKWINLGGGHHITKEGYNIPLLESEITRIKQKYNVQIYLEPGEAVALSAGYMVSTVLDIVHNGLDICVLDASAECHMPDVLEMPYRPQVLGGGQPGEKAHTYRLASKTCLAGDILGDYSFDSPLKIGDKVVLGDMAIYSMVKNNTFNGMPLPDIAIKKGEEIRIWKRFSYEDFKRRV